MKKDIIEVDRNNRGISANCEYTEERKTVEILFENEVDRMKVFAEISNYKFENGSYKYDPLPKKIDGLSNDELLGQRITDLELALLEGGIIKI